ncbi:MAG: tetratricopeptide repeat protein [Alistipes sp.]|nr:tetratricopeptide repeat protein [Alistipes sp.]
MEIINIFLAGSTSMESERNLVRTCANKLQADQCAKGRDIAINITTFENFNSAITEVKAQELYDEYIHSEADYAMFIFDNSVGGISKHEFDVAYDAFKNNDKPKLYVYFKKSDNYCTEYEEIRQLLIHSSNYFREYNNFTHLSTIISDHLREIIDTIIEKIIIKSYRKKGRLTLIANRDCEVYEKQEKIFNLKYSTPHTHELTEGIHLMTFKDRESQETIDRKIQVLGNATRKVEVLFKNEPTKNFTLGYFLVAAIIIFAFASYIKFKDVQPEENIELQLVQSNDTNIYGGQIYQEALKEIEKGNYTLAINKLQTVINNDAQFADAHIHLANIYIKQGNYKDANDHLDIALEINPDSPWANELKGRITF